MQLDQNPVNRKFIAPWYDSETVCWIAIVLMGAVLFFALTGVSIVRENVLYRSYLWVPVLLAVLSGIVLVSVAWRLTSRYAARRAPR